MRGALKHLLMEFHNAVLSNQVSASGAALPGCERVLPPHSTLPRSDKTPSAAAA